LCPIEKSRLLGKTAAFSSCHKFSKNYQIGSKSVPFPPANSPHNGYMPTPLFRNRICKLAALIATALFIPVLPYAGTDNGNGNGGQNNGNQNGHHKDPVVPETNPLCVLIPVAGAVMLFSAREFARRKG
jgi:hypothetical protein